MITLSLKDPTKSALNCLVTLPPRSCKIPHALTFPSKYSSIKIVGSVFLKSYVLILLEQLVTKAKVIINKIEFTIFIFIMLY